MSSHLVNFYKNSYLDKRRAFQRKVHAVLLKLCTGLVISLTDEPKAAAANLN